MQYTVAGQAVFLSTLSLRRATCTPGAMYNFAQFLSTLSLRRATDGRYGRHYRNPISIHALLAESDCSLKQVSAYMIKFLSTLSLRRATHTGIPTPFCDVFLSTLSLRRATGIQSGAQQATAISIHALLAESDRWTVRTTLPKPYFYPRSPCGERPQTLQV